MAGLDTIQAAKVFMDKIQLNEEDRTIIEQATRQQSDNTIWHSQRQGRITASKVKDVFTRMGTLLKKDVNPKVIIASVMGYGPKVTTIAMKHGRAQEVHAKRFYTRLTRRNHRRFHATDSGLVVDQNVPFVAASPDLCVECSCHGKGLCEIKCPHSICDSVPSDTNLSYLVKQNDKITLKTSSEYYYQIQCQMSVCKLQYCDFFCVHITWVSSGTHFI